LGADGDFGAATGYGVEDSIGGVLGGDREAGGFGGEGEPAAFELYVAYDVDVVFAAGAHESGADGGYANAFVGRQSCRRCSRC